MIFEYPKYVCVCDSMYIICMWWWNSLRFTHKPNFPHQRVARQTDVWWDRSELNKSRCKIIKQKQLYFSSNLPGTIWMVKTNIFWMRQRWIIIVRTGDIFARTEKTMGWVCHDDGDWIYWGDEAFTTFEKCQLNLLC